MFADNHEIAQHIFGFCRRRFLSLSLNRWSNFPLIPFLLWVMDESIIIINKSIRRNHSCQHKARGALRVRGHKTANLVAFYWMFSKANCFCIYLQARDVKLLIHIFFPGR